MTWLPPPSMPPAPVRVVRMDRKIDECWLWLPRVSARVAAFGAHLGQVPAEGLARRLEASFVLGDQAETAWAAWIAIQGDRLVGHLLATEETYNEERIGMVAQVWLEPHTVPRSLQREVLFELGQWRDAHQFPRLLMITARHRPRAWKVLGGFTPWRVIYALEAPTA